MDNKNLSTLITIVFLFVGLIVFFTVFAMIDDFQKVQCVKEGGKWVTGIIGGSYSAFCMPQ